MKKFIEINFKRDVKPGDRFLFEGVWLEKLDPVYLDDIQYDCYEIGKGHLMRIHDVTDTVTVYR